MIPVLNAAEMREADRRTIERIGLAGVVLMENAGAAVADAIRKRFAMTRRLSVLCGMGNNGGDGFVAARRLLDLGARVYLIGSRKEVRGDARQHLAACEATSGREVTEVLDAGAWDRLREEALAADVIVDALLGTGLGRAPSGVVGHVIADLEARVDPARIVAVDLPSGVSSDGGQLAGHAVRAGLTVTFAAAKYGHVLPPASDHVGELVIAEIGIPGAVVASMGSTLGCLEPADAAAAFPPRPAGAHKGDFGHLLVIAGSVGKSGAAVLSALGALRAGAGLVTVATPAPALPLVAAGRAEVMTEPLAVDGLGGLGRDAIRRALALAAERDAVVLGPGLGQDPGTREFVREFVQECPGPLVVDADGLNALAQVASGGSVTFKRDAPTILTPHPGEMARLAAATSGDVQRDRLEAARALAASSGALIVLKGQRTIVADPEGRAAVNPTGNAGMASGGSGDVLAGVIGALLARRCSGWLAATAGVYVHGLAGDRAAARLGPDSLLAGDVADGLAEAVRSLPRSDA